MQSHKIILNAGPHTEWLTLASHSFPTQVLQCFILSLVWHFSVYSWYPSIFRHNCNFLDYNKLQLVWLLPFVANIAVYLPYTWAEVTRQNNSWDYLMQTSQTNRSTSTSHQNLGHYSEDHVWVNADSISLKGKLLITYLSFLTCMSIEM